MAKTKIAGASRVGKSAFDRAAILREAHAATRRRLVPSHYQRNGDRYDPELRAWVPTTTYRVIFATKLRGTWHAHKLAAAEAKWEAAHPVSADILAEAAAVRADAWFEPITAAGNARLAEAYLAASALIEAARFGSLHA